MDKNQVKKLSRELWDCIVEIFSDSVQTKRSAADSNQTQNDSTQIIRESPNACLTRESFCKFIKTLKIPHLLSILLSLLSTLYNVIDSSVNNEITSEYKQYWPLSVSSSANINLNCLMDTLNGLVKHCLAVDPYNSIWLRTIGDFSLSQSLLSDSIKYYLQVIINDTGYLFSNQNINKLMNEKLLKSMIKSLLILNKNTQAALLCQYLPLIDYTTAFKCIQEKISIDETDLFYSCVWDVTLLEYLAYTNTQRSFNAKRDLAIKLLSDESINSSNPSDIHQKMINFKRNQMLMLLIKHYLLSL
jgi:integrator complex subunit 8